MVQAIALLVQLHYLIVVQIMLSLTNSIATVLAASTVGNNLTISSSGAITQTGVLTVPGTSSFSAGANAITLNTMAQAIFTGAVSFSNSGANDDVH